MGRVNRLSVLDLVPLGRGRTSTSALADAVTLARAVERLGFERLWYAEHHNMPGITTTTPEILIAHVGQATTRIRLGAGGVMLPNHAPLKVAESYRLLEALHPGRIDLGIGRAPGTDPLTAMALRRSMRVADDFLDQLAELRAYDGGDGAPIRAMPDDVPLPPIWLLGSSDYSARVAAELGLGFAFAGHFSDEPAEGPMRLYRDRFRPGPLEKPHAILALAIFCAETAAAATRLGTSALASIAELRAGRPARLLSPEEAAARTFSPVELATIAHFRHLQIAGTPEEVRARVDAIVERTGADEVMVATHAYHIDERIHSFELVAQAFGLGS
jgi:luciferase family oxidoreductase group 1